MSYPHFSSDCSEHHHVVKDYGGPKPEIVVLCGSTRFVDEFAACMRELTLQGYLVIGPGAFGMSGTGVEADEVKLALDQLHLRKIDLADYVYVVNPDGYIGHSTKSEIIYAAGKDIPVLYLVKQVTVAPGLKALIPDKSEEKKP